VRLLTLGTAGQLGLPPLRTLAAIGCESRAALARRNASSARGWIPAPCDIAGLFSGFDQPEQGSKPLPPHALFEVHLDVHDLERSIAFYRDIVGLELAYALPKRHVTFFWIGGRGHSMLGLWSGGSSPNAMRLHTAFALSLDAVLASPSTLRYGRGRAA
jgi:Glyoxalase/Bleomycin resistance protein/Dioxygenase superfamily